MMQSLNSEVVNYAWPVTSINYFDYIAFEEWYTKYNIGSLDKKIIIYGAGIRGTEIYYCLKEMGFENFIFTDSNSEKWSGCIEDKKIIEPVQAYELVKKGEAWILISTENYKVIASGLEKEGLVAEKDYFYIDAKMYERYTEEFKRPCNNKYLFMGDCEYTTISVNDDDKRNLGEMLKDSLGCADTKILAMHGMGLRSFYNIYNVYVDKYGAPNSLVVMINFDTLNGMQHLLPRSQHEELLINIYNMGNDANSEFKEYLADVHERTNNLNAEFQTKSKSNSKLKNRNYMKLNYLYSLNIATEGVVYLEKLVKKVLSQNVKVLPYIPPVNYKMGEELFGDEFHDKYSENVNKIQDILKKYDVELLDMSYLLDTDCFAELNTPDETANQKGRRLIVNTMKERLGRLL